MTNTIFTFIIGLCVGSIVSTIIGMISSKKNNQEWIRITEKMQSQYLKLKIIIGEEIEFYKKRCKLLAKAQSKFRNPERQITCNILANASPHPLGWNGMSQLLGEDSKDE